MLAERRYEPYSLVIRWLHCRFSYAQIADNAWEVLGPLLVMLYLASVEAPLYQTLTNTLNNVKDLSLYMYIYHPTHQHLSHRQLLYLLTPHFVALQCNSWRRPPRLKYSVYWFIYHGKCSSIPSWLCDVTMSLYSIIYMHDCSIPE